ncbi:hypothetical protein CHGG_09719 [Chaetomium globosum CBS 148.51]|uniref:Uncharacterized protein n=1 Tax=Chaetomium globosum (strain ATCC 6205 / CBS 148.51 / DSM 1962 / NBRC 6347 / NRRL 1970) TaxID=306901 RepID=Q2GQN5_CHAGB|nr:uncharacterized protein CHGG_09719 [Chaetomium globosum CBS 148.51]EAQ83315.1 hypothetical protein CHGG_09719 [Chaetomium globosum CBS 148.51]
MVNQESRAVLDSLLTKTHVQHALVQSDGRHNELPSVREPYNINEASVLKVRRFQRAFMTYFSMENGRFAGNTKSLAISHFFTGTSPLIYGLFSGIGRPLTLLADGIELRAAILVMQSLTLSAVDWMEPLGELLTHPQLAAPSGEYLSPEDIIGRVAYDGRFSGVMKAGSGFHGVSHVFSSPTARTGIVEYLRYLDTRDLSSLLQQISALSVLLLTATHKANQPAFDLYLGRLPTCVNSVRVIVENWVEDEGHKLLLVRGLWLLVILTYVTQLRPVIDGKLLVSRELAEETRGWEAIMDRIHSQCIMEGRDGGHDLLRAVRSLRELSGEYGAAHGRLYIHAAWKLLRNWQGWAGLGNDREATLNIRL